MPKHCFLRRQQLAMRGRTRGGQTTPKDACEKLECFSTKVLSKMKEFKISKIYNADKTGVNYEYISATIVNAKGAITVTCAGKSKERVTAMLLDDSDINKAKPFLVFETRPSNLAAKARQNKICHHGFGSKLWSKLKGQQGSKSTETGRGGGTASCLLSFSNIILGKGATRMNQYSYYGMQFRVIGARTY
ncbi:LOW QUALITY PROTEIN: hypothetical protein PHMEG_00016996 [Phytophthora megakarya]|uniref:Uncharacterized protein n=1 Tax=Phytophthora megakarya TaxID=4795 RepID=A0A225VXD3_9STRA|nr:LOW QUALITY PROTEIN: hypothetical protein PHMEG_00016996 [Phytophthora megakarya]